MLNRVALRFVLAFVLAGGLAACGDTVTAPSMSDLGPSLSTTTSGTIYDVVTLAGDGSAPKGVNDGGTVVGYVTRDFARRAAYWTVDASGSVTGPVELPIPGSGESAGMRANDQGQMIVRAGGTSTATGFVYDIGTGELVELSPAEGADDTGGPWAINASGVVTASATFETQDGLVRRPLVWLTPFDPTVGPTVLPLPQDHLTVCSRVHRTHVNDAGVVVGSSRTPEGDCVPVRWQIESDGTITGPEAFSGAVEFVGFDLNDDGQLVGSLPDSRAGVLQPDGIVVELPAVDGDVQLMAGSISDPAAGDPALAAGVSDAWGDDEKAVVWSVDLAGNVSGPVELPTSKHATSRALAVNADGWVAGQITDSRPNRGTSAVLWIPAQDDGGSGGGDDGSDCVPKGPHGNNCK